MESIKSFLGYFFTSVPGKEFKYYTHFYILIGILILGSILFGYFYSKKKKTDIAFKRSFKKTASKLMLFAILFAILLLLRYEEIPYFSTRIILYLSVIVFLYWAYKSIKTYKITYLKEKGPKEEKKTDTKEKIQEKTYSASKK